MSAHNILQLHLLTNCKTFPDNKYFQFIELCAKAGISHLQLRQKDWKFPDLLAFGRDIMSILSANDVPLIVNDDVNLMLELDAKGIHLGQTDSHPKLVRKLIGQNKIIGLSIESMDELHVANKLDCIDYVAASSVFPTQTKKNLKTIWGLDGLNQLCQKSIHPVIAIGGINLGNVELVCQTEIAGIAVISAVHDAKNPELYIQKLRTHLSNPTSTTETISK